MLYQQAFYATEPLGNNALSYDRRDQKKLFVPALKDGDFSDVKIGNEVVFEDFDERNRLRSAVGLEHFIRTKWKWIPVIVVDNHNHVLYFWYEARKNGIVENGATLVHIDEHSDLWNNAFQLSSEESKDLEKVFRFTNFQCNVGNYILPAKDEGLIGEIWRVEGENDLIKYQDSDPKKNSILNLDLDFFSPELEYIDYKMKKDTILRIATRVRLITIATSPFFIDQKRALEVLHDLFD